VRRRRRRSRRGRVVGTIVVLVGVAAGATWFFVGKGYLPLQRAEAKPAAPAPVPIIATEDEDAHWESPRVPTLDELAARDKPLRPRLGAGEASAELAAAKLAPTADPVVEMVGEGEAGPRPGALKPVAPPGGPAEQSAGDVSGAEMPPVDKPAAADRPAPDAAAHGDQSATGNIRIDAALKLLADGKIIEARHALNALLAQPLPRNEQAEVRRRLAKIADDSIFSRRALAGDPLADTYTVQSGDRLVNLSRDYKVPAEILMYINGIQDATKMRAEQKLKVLRGPFHVKISKSEFRMDVYLQDLYVRSYRVGLGADQGTPEGVWKVKDRLERPTYYPPASAEVKRIIPPDDPENPLGNYWIGLEGVSGDAVGHTGYGMHGTIEPESIGQAASMGCVRMLNEDVEFLYKLMLPGESTVTVLP